MHALGVVVDYRRYTEEDMSYVHKVKCPWFVIQDSLRISEWSCQQYIFEIDTTNCRGRTLSFDFSVQSLIAPQERIVSDRNQGERLGKAKCLTKIKGFLQDGYMRLFNEIGFCRPFRTQKILQPGISST